jgi:hypothetical protein
MDRRDFIKLSGSAAASMLLTSTLGFGDRVAFADIKI